ncbi:MAG: DUF3857 domain-containing protein [Bacteroidota bacterium]
MMNKYFFLGLAIMLPYVFNAQLIGRFSDKNKKKASEEFYEKVMESEAKDFEITEVPEKWKNEPVVMLCQKLLMATKVQLREGYGNKVIVRKRLKIQDKSALEDYSTFYFSAEEFVSVKVIKASGKEISVNMSKAAEVDTEVPRKYRGFFRSEKYYKIAIPNLEVGDILDFAKVFVEYTVLACSFAIDTEISFDYPVVYQKFVFDSDVAVQLVYNSFNDAPKFELLKGRSTSTYLKYPMGGQRLVMEDKDRSAANKERWYSTSQHEPIIKVSMSGSIVEKNRGKKPDPKSNLNWENTLKNASQRLKVSRLRYAIDDVEERLKKMDVDFEALNNEEKINTIHRAMRYVMNYTFPLNYDFSSGSNYMVIMSKMLEENEIPFQYVITHARSSGGLENILFFRNFTYGIYVPELDKYYWPSGGWEIAGQTRFDIAGTIGKKASKGKVNKPLGEFEDANIPVTQSKDNILKTEMDITMTNDNALNMSNRVSYGGGHRANYFTTLVSIYDYIIQEELAISNEKTREKLKKAKPDAMKEAIKEADRYKEENVEALIKSDYEINELLHHQVVEYGNTNESPNLIWEYQATSDAYVSKAGNNLILALGKLISSQVELTDEEIENRTRDVNYDFAREFVHEINITLPEGYVAKGLEQFNMNIDSEQAAFISSAMQEGNMLKLKARKAYKSQTVPVENWSELVEMLEAAYNFTQKKVILSKI